MKKNKPENISYDLKSVNFPHVTGNALRLFAELLEGPARAALMPKLFKDAGVTWFREQSFNETPTVYPIAYSGRLAKSSRNVPKNQLPSSVAHSGPGFHYPTVHAYAEAYRNQETTPEVLAQRVLDAIKAGDSMKPPLKAIIASDSKDVMEQARAATERIKNGKPLSVFDGVPVVVKDEIQQKSYPTTLGTSFLGKDAATKDATVVARLRAAGALLIGKSNMHEIGIGVTGLNTHHGPPRNPYHTSHYTGGSSSGSGAAVAAGICPVAVGADGGGSIRIPAALCGQVGLKCTFGRVSEHGAVPLCWSVAHIGPIANSTIDVALMYGIIAGPDPHDPISLHQPLPTLAGIENTDLSDLTLGVYWPWFRHANAEIVSACEALLKAFEKKGAKIQEIVIPDLEAARLAHTVTIGSEMSQAMSDYYGEHRRDHGLDVRINLALARDFTARDYVKAQQVRTRMNRHFNQVFEQVDLVITPTTGVTAPAIPKAALARGESDLTTLTEIMRFVPIANLTGLPAISFPAGYDKAGLPIGMQAIGRAWEETTLLRLALTSEEIVERRKPSLYYDLLGQRS